VTVGRPSLILAALAADAAPGFAFRSYRRVETNPDIDQLQLWDEDGASYQLLIPATPAGESEVAIELQALKIIEPYQEFLGIDTPRLIGQSTDSDGAGALFLTLLGGETTDLAKYAPGLFSKSIGEVLARIHNLSPDIIREAGLLEYDAASILRHKVVEIDSIAQTGRVPAALLSRWEAATEDIGLFRFHPTVIHGNVSQETVMVSAQKVNGLSGWSSLKVGDPAEDLRWLTGGALRTTLEDTILNYRATRETADENISQRAQLYSELELGSWLVYCIANKDEKEISQAEDMIAELRDQLESGNLRSLRASSFAGIASLSVAAEPHIEASSLQEEDLETQELIQQQDSDLAEGEALEADFTEDADREAKNEEELF
jgi:aminoglycoside phosphotransferase (APT) family kinase protein